MVENVIGQYNCKVNKKYVNIQFAKRLQVHIQSLFKALKAKHNYYKERPEKGVSEVAPTWRKKLKKIS